MMSYCSVIACPNRAVAAQGGVWLLKGRFASHDDGSSTVVMSVAVLYQHRIAHVI